MYPDYHPNVTLDKAEVNLFVNGVFKERMSFQEGDEAFNTKGYFKSDFIPVKGDRIRVEASYPGKKYTGNPYRNRSYPAW